MSRRRWWIAVVVVLALALSAGLAWLALPGVVQWLVVRQIESLTSRPVTIERFELDLARGRLGIEGFRLADHTAGPPLAEVEQLHLRFDPRAILRGHLHVETATVASPRVRIARGADGRLNISDLLEREQAGPPAAVTIDRLAVSGGVVTVEDGAHEPSRTWRAEGIAIEAAALSTVDPQARGTARLTATMAGAPIALDVSEVRLAPIHLRGRLTLQDVDAAPAGIALAAGAPVELERAIFTAALELTLDALEGFQIDGQGQIEHLVVRRRGAEESLATAPSLTFSLAASDGPDGAFRLDHLDATGSATLFDARTSPPSPYPIEHLRLRLEADDGAEASAVRVRFSAGLPAGGDVSAQGIARLEPPGAELEVRVVGLDLGSRAWESWLPVRVSGVAESDLLVDVTYSGGLTTRIRGRAAARGVELTGEDGALATARQIELAGIDASWPRVRIGRITVTRPTAVVTRDGAGRVALSELIPATGPSRTPGPGATPTATLEIDEIALDDGTVSLRDATVDPPAALHLSAVRANAREVAWPARRPAKLQLAATLPESGTLDADGTISLDPLRLDLRARLAGAALGPYQPYAPVDGRIEGRLDAEVTVTAGQEVAAAVRGTASLSDLAIADGTRALLRVARVQTSGIEYTWPTSAKIDRLHVQTPWALIERRRDGSLPLLSLFGPVPAPPAGAGDPESAGAGDPAAAGIDVAVRETVIEGAAARVIDRVVRPAARLDIAGGRLVARDLAWPPRGPAAVELMVPTPGGGSLSASGRVDLGARGLDLQVVLRGADVASVLPYLPLRGRISGRASGNLQVMATLDPLAIGAHGTASLDDVSLTDGDRPLLEVGRLETAGLDYTWPAAVAVERLHVQGAWALIERGADGTFPLRAVFGPWPGASGEAPLPGAAPGGAAPPLGFKLSIAEGVVEEGAATIIDGAVAPAARFEIAGSRLAVRDLTWPALGPTAVQMRSSMPGGGTLTASGHLDLRAPSLDVEVTLAGVALAPAQPYLPLKARIAARASGDLRVQATVDPLAIAARGRASLEDLALADGDRPVLTAGRVDADGIDYTWPAAVAVDRLRLRQPWVHLERGADGSVPLRALLVPDAAPPPETAASGAPGPSALDVHVRQAVLEDGGVTIADGAVTPPAGLELTGVSLGAGNLAWPPRGATSLELRAPAPGGGSLEARGQVHLDGSSLDMRVVLDRVDLALGRSYLRAGWTVAGLAEGDFRVTGNLADPALSVAGHLAVTDVALGDAERTLVSLGRVDVAGLDAEWPRRIAAEQVTIRQPWSLVELEADGGLPLLSLLAPRAATVGAAASGADPAFGDPDAPAPRLEVGAVVVEGGFMRFVDRTTRPRFVEEASNIAVTAKGLDTAPAARSPITVTGRLTGGAMFDLEGEVGPIGGPLDLDIRGELSDFSLPRANPYADRALGWVARRGGLDVTLHYRLRDGQLDARNDVLMGQPEFVHSRRGDEVRERLGVPLDLLVSLLKNARNEVRLSVPITGDVAEGRFDFGGAIWDGIRRTVISVLALPVSWVGRIFYTADARIDTIRIWPVTFEPGTTTMRRDITAHADRLATFLRDAPGVVLLMKPILTADDIAALRRDAVRQQIGARGGELAPAAQAAAARLFAERFPDRSLPSDPEALLDQLASVEPLPPGAGDALATRRVELTRQQLAEQASVDPDRLRPGAGPVPVESSGPGRVEFEIEP